MEFVHVGIPTGEPRRDETYLEDLKLHVTNAEEHPYAVEWLRFDEDSPMPEPLKTRPHVAYKVDSVERAIEGKDVLVEPLSPMKGVKIAFIMHDGVPIEFLEIAR
jgi:hypothetical protein